MTTCNEIENRPTNSKPVADLIPLLHKLSLDYRLQQYPELPPHRLIEQEILVALAIEPQRAHTPQELSTRIGIHGREIRHALNRLHRKLLILKSGTIYKLTSTGERIKQSYMNLIHPVMDSLSRISGHTQQELKITALDQLREAHRRTPFPFAKLCGHCLYFRPYSTGNPKRPHSCAMTNTEIPNQTRIQLPIKIRTARTPQRVPVISP